jgi:hypothetical protein
LQEGRLQDHVSTFAPKVDRMPTNPKGRKELGEALIDAVGFLSFLFGSLILLAIVFGTIGSIFMSTKRLFKLKRVKKDEDNTHSEPEGGGR